MVSFRFPWILAALACAALVFAVPLPATADLIAPAPQNGVQAPAADTVASAAPHDAVLAALHASGMSADEAASRLAELTAADLETLAASPEQVQVAGAGMTVLPILIIIGIAAVGALYLLITNQL